MADHPEIKVGSKGAAVKLAQERLDRRGYHLKQDGDFGPTTLKRVKEYQKDRASDTVQPLKEDGIIGPKTWARLDPPLTKQGAKGDAVKLLQHLLGKNGHPVTVDGDFGPNTKAATVAFQKGAGLSPDGDAGPLTWTALKS